MANIVVTNNKNVNSYVFSTDFVMPVNNPFYTTYNPNDGLMLQVNIHKIMLLITMQTKEVL